MGRNLFHFFYHHFLTFSLISEEGMINTAIVDIYFGEETLIIVSLSIIITSPEKGEQFYITVVKR